MQQLTHFKGFELGVCHRSARQEVVAVEEDELVNIPTLSGRRREGAWRERRSFRDTGSGCCRVWEGCQTDSRARLPPSLGACSARQVGADHQGDPVHYPRYSPQGREGFRVALYNAVVLAPTPLGDAGSVSMSWFQEGGFGQRQ